MMSRFAALMAMLITLALGLAGCGTYVPEGGTVVKVNGSKREFDRGELRQKSNGMGRSEVYRMRWYDTNTFVTTASLTPGVYTFTARNYDGGGVLRDITIESGKGLYEIQENEGAAPGEASQPAVEVEGPTVKGRIAAMRGGQVSVMFISQSIVMRQATVSGDGSFSVTAPAAGNWRVEVHLLGNPPKSWSGPVQNIAAPVDLGMINLQ